MEGYEFRILGETEIRLIYQLFTIKVADEIGHDRTMELLKAAKKQALNKQ